MPTDYSKGKIYAIKSYQTDDIYIGSTCQPLRKRLHDHKIQYKRYLYKKNVDNYTSFEILKYGDAYIELIQEIPCVSRMELCKYEGQYIRTMKCVNNRVAGRTSYEYSKEKRKQISKYQKKWYIKNKCKLTTKKKCICGGSITSTHKARHFKSMKHRQYIFNLHNELNHL
jgi:hypothetical protein